MARSLLTLNDLTRAELFSIFERTKVLKSRIDKRKSLNILENRVVGTLFEKPSTRTRTSFETAAIRLGGEAIYLPYSELQLRRGEPVKDTARILGSYLDGIVARVYSHKTVEELAEHSGIPVINGLSDLTHPTQTICDLFTILEVKGRLAGLNLGYIGDGDNICNSLLLGCALAGVNMTAACPKGYHPEAAILDDAKKIAAKTGAKFEVVEEPRAAAKGADVLYTDVWVSMGDESEKDARVKAFQGYQINAELVKEAAKDASVMHCLPAHRGWEITDDVIEGPQSVAWQQGANKMYSAAGILDFLVK